MSTLYSGSAANVTIPQPILVTGATNATPIVVATGTAHGFSSGDAVIIQNVGGNVAANSPPNAPWIVTVVDSTHFSLNGSAGSGAYTSSGACYDVSPNPPITIPSDGDPFTAASANAAFQTLADRSRFCFDGLGNYRVQNIYSARTEDDTWPGWITNWGVSSSTWTNVQDGFSTDVSDFYNFMPPFDARCDDGDVLVTQWQLGLAYLLAGGAGAASLKLSVVISSQALGAAFSDGGDAAYLNSGSTAVLTPVRGESLIRVVANGGAATISAAGSGSMTLTGLSGMSATSVGDKVTISGAANPGNSGTFPVTSYVSGSSVVVANAGGVFPDANSGSLIWRVSGMKMSFHLQARLVAGSTQTLNANGYRGMHTIHYRQTAPRWPNSQRLL